MLKLPPILPSSTSVTRSGDTHAYEQWRANIHRELEEDLQRQVRELLDETERQERLAKLQRAGRCLPSTDEQEQSVDTLNEIDRRNQHVLQPKDSSKASPKPLSIYSDPFESSAKKAFYFNSYHHYRARRRSSQRTEEQTYLNPSVYLNKYSIQQSARVSYNNDPSFIFGNSIIKSNKADVLYVFDQQLINGCETSTYTDKYGVIIDENGPFWPENYRILHPTPKLLSRKLIPKEFYLSPSMPNTIYQQTYDNQPAISKYADVPKHPTIVYDMDKSSRNQPIKSNEHDQMCPSLIFESRFEGGNLRQVRRVGRFEYELVLRPDLYTRRHTQWYYFRVQNMLANVTYRFRIINLMKRNSLYNDGMQSLLFSDVDAKKESRGWHRVGHHISYSEYRPRTYHPLLERDIDYYELDFQFEFPHSGDTCYIAHCYPYTFTDLKDDLEYLSLSRPRDVFRRDVLCESQAGNSCFIITVTDESVPLHKKKFVFITARIHPGETNSSYMMRGLLEFISSTDPIAQRLRSQLVFKIIPMLNPDGVIVGNYRCSLTGKDMNRNFRHPRKQTFPIIYHMKELMQSLQREHREILAYCDLHGHSRKSNVFAYGCDGCDGPQPDMKNFLNARVLPFLMSKTAPDMFAFDYCKFHIHRCKESTGRVVMWKEMLIKNSFTLEASFAGTSIVEKPCHFNIQDYEKFGQCICQSLRQYLDILSDASRLDSIFMDITKNILRRLDKEKIPLGLLPVLYPGNGQLIVPIHSVSSCLEVLTQCHPSINEQDASSSSDSDSDPEGGELPDLVYRKDKQKTKKKLKKKRSEKTVEETSPKSSRKQQANRSKLSKSPSKSLKDEGDSQSQIQTSHLYPSAIDINSQLKQTLNVDQLDKASRTLPEKGQIFTSKYANRHGHGMPIFTTERAVERRHQLKRSDSILNDANRQSIDGYETDTEPSPLLAKIAKSQAEMSTNLDPNVKRTASLISMPNSFSDPIISHTLTSPSPMFKSLPQRRAHRVPVRQPRHSSPSNADESEPPMNTQPPIITMPHLMEFRKHLNRSSSMHDNDTPITETPTEPSSFRSLSKHEIPVIRTKMPLSTLNTTNTTLKRAFSQRMNHFLIQQPLSSIESVLKERSLSITQANHNVSDGRQILKKPF